jgi:ribosomal protein L30E
MAKEQTDQNLIELKAKLLESKVIIGTERVVKTLKTGKLEKVFLASNCPENVKTDIKKLAGIRKIAIEKLKLNNEELGVFCKKNFFVSVLGTIK